MERWKVRASVALMLGESNLAEKISALGLQICSYHVIGEISRRRELYSSYIQQLVGGHARESMFGVR